MADRQEPGSVSSQGLRDSVVSALRSLFQGQGWNFRIILRLICFVGRRVWGFNPRPGHTVLSLNRSGNGHYLNPKLEIRIHTFVRNEEMLLSLQKLIVRHRVIVKICRFNLTLSVHRFIPVLNSCLLKSTLCITVCLHLIRP